MRATRGQTTTKPRRMRIYKLLLTVALGALALCAPPHSDNKDAPPCDTVNCVAPACRCASTETPLNLDPSEVPQLVTLTFDDDVNILNMNYYRQLYTRTSAGNGCPIGVTYYVCHEYNEYQFVHELYAHGHDISVHSISHKSDTQYWANADSTVWAQEMWGMRQMLAKYAAVPLEDVRGDRAPFLQAGGDNQFRALAQNGLEWDSSMPTQMSDPPIYPYTLDYKSDKDCEVPPCPVESYPGFWAIPMVDLRGADGQVCAMVDQCQPAPTSAQDAFNLLKSNFDRHYLSNRAPFGVYAHAAWFMVNETNNWQGYLQFVDYLATLPDVFVVNVRQVVEWMKQPTSLANIGSFAPFACPARTPAACVYQECYFPSANTPFNSERYMGSCTQCPPYYPWLDNVDGLKPYSSS